MQKCKKRCAVELTRRNIPYVQFGGLKFLDAAHIKDVLALLRWSQNPKDRVSAFRVSQLMPGIGPADAARLLKRMDSSLDTADALRSFKPPTAASEAWPAFAELFRLLRSNAAGWPAELDLVCQWYLPHLERNHDDAAAIRQPDLIQLANRRIISQPRTLPDRAHARPAGRHQR